MGYRVVSSLVCNFIAIVTFFSLPPEPSAREAYPTVEDFFLPDVAERIACIMGTRRGLDSVCRCVPEGINAGSRRRDQAWSERTFGDRRELTIARFLTPI